MISSSSIDRKLLSQGVGKSTKGGKAGIEGGRKSEWAEREAKTFFLPFSRTTEKKEKNSFSSEENERRAKAKKKISSKGRKKNGAIDTVLLYLVSFKERIILYF